MKKKLAQLALAAALLVLVLTGCDRQATRVSYNVSKEADNFNVVRRLTVINTRSDKVILQMVGRMSIEDQTDGIAALVEIDRDRGIYQKHYIYMNEWTMYTVEDLNGVSVSAYDYEIEFMPKSIIDIKITANEIKQDNGYTVVQPMDSDGEEGGDEDGNQTK